MVDWPESCLFASLFAALALVIFFITDCSKHCIDKGLDGGCSKKSECSK